LSADALIVATIHSAWSGPGTSSRHQHLRVEAGCMAGPSRLRIEAACLLTVVPNIRLSRAFDVQDAVGQPVCRISQVVRGLDLLGQDGFVIDDRQTVVQLHVVLLVIAHAAGRDVVHSRRRERHATFGPADQPLGIRCGRANVDR
jgi:hypothetical protein